MNRRSFITNLSSIGLFTILPGAGRVWCARKPVDVMQFFDMPRRMVSIPTEHYLEIYSRLIEITSRAIGIPGNFSHDHPQRPLVSR